MTDINLLKRLDGYRDRELGLPASPLDIPVSAEMISAGVSAGLSADIYPGDGPFSEAVVLRIYLAMERARQFEKPAGPA